MNYISHLNTFFNHLKKDNRLTSSHVSLYMALFQYWNFNRFQNPFPIYREDVMKLSKIGSKNTYHKCVKDLHLAKYIYYHSAISKYQPIKVSMLRLEVQKEQIQTEQLDLFSPKNETHTSTENGTVHVPDLTDTSPNNGTTQVPNMGHLIKHKHIKQERETNSLSQKIFSKNENLQKRINNLAGANSEHDTERSRSTPTLSEVEVFFQKKNYPLTEAQKFYNHYESNGWLVGGKTPMQSWQSSAHKWMLNVENFKPVSNGKSQNQQKGNFDPGPGKDYSEPL